MDLETWNCCRFCLSVQSLFPIFSCPEYHEKYAEVLFTATGMKVEINDNLPQLLCTSCISFINETVKFRKKCEETTVQLLGRLHNKEYSHIKIESTPVLKTENGKPLAIDISHLLEDFDNEFQDLDDNITLDNLQLTKTDKTESVGNKIQHDTLIDSKKSIKKIKTERPKRRVRSKTESGVKERRVKNGERVSEQVECEYCHKILTSRLSLRNHYKIHTGFDVVCEHCGKKFITKRLLLMHCRAKHGYEKTDKCSYCDYRASNAEQVKIHERLHTGEKPFVCSSCGASFHRKSSYLQHVAIHLPDKSVQCDQCPALFKSVTLMRIHRSRHRAPAHSFQCALCEGHFARRRNVARHLQRVHGTAPLSEHIRRKQIL